MELPYVLSALAMVKTAFVFINTKSDADAGVLRTLRVVKGVEEVQQQGEIEATRL